MHNGGSVDEISGRSDLCKVVRFWFSASKNLAHENESGSEIWPAGFPAGQIFLKVEFW